MMPAMTTTSLTVPSRSPVTAVGLVLAAGFVGCVFLANWLTTRYGMVGLGFGLSATAGTLAADDAIDDAIDDILGVDRDRPPCLNLGPRGFFCTLPTDHGGRLHAAIHDSGQRIDDWPVAGS